MLTATNPASGETLAPKPSLDSKEAAALAEKVSKGFPSWRAKPFSERAAVLEKIAAALREDQEKLAELMALEMGKPYKEGLGEVEKAAWCAEFYAQHAEAFLKPETIESDASKSYIQFQALGTVLGILPWNAPVWLALRFMAPALMAGNTCLMKADPNVPATAERLTQAFYRAGLPENVMVNLPITTELVGDIIAHPGVKAVSFTGSSRAGQKVAAAAASDLKPSVLELGGSDPCIVMADADLEKAASVVTLSRMINAGQSCIAAKRLLVESSIYDTFCQMLHERFSAISMGEPMDENNNLGPLARADLRDELHRQVQKSIQAGARCTLGGELPEGPGFFYPPTLLLDVKPDMACFQEEVFGPVLSVTAFKDIEEALSLANATEYGLGSSIWTQSQDHIDQAVSSLQAGQIAVNGIVKTDPRLPSGGIGKSGYGRELGPQGIKEFVNVQQVWIA